MLLRYESDSIESFNLVVANDNDWEMHSKALLDYTVEVEMSSSPELMLSELALVLAEVNIYIYVHCV